MKQKVLLTVLFYVLLATIQAQTIFSEVHKENQYPFLLAIPPDSVDSQGPSPLLVFLHGRSLSGSDLTMVKKYGVLHEMEKKGRFVPGYVIGPQVKKGESWNPDKILQLVEYMIRNYNIDSSRIYIAGMSLGGYGTLHFAGKYPKRVTAAVALCGGGDVRDGCRLAEVPLWIEHGDQDESVPVNESSERCAISGLLQNFDLLNAMAWPEELFFRQAHKIILQAVRDLHEAGVKTDFFAVQAELERKGVLGDIGGDFALMELRTTSSFSSIARAAGIRRKVSGWATSASGASWPI